MESPPRRRKVSVKKESKAASETGGKKRKARVRGAETQSATETRLQEEYVKVEPSRRVLRPRAASRSSSVKRDEREKEEAEAKVGTEGGHVAKRRRGRPRNPSHE